MDAIKAAERTLGEIHGTSRIKTKLSKARRSLLGNSPKPDQAAKFLAEARQRYSEDVAWRRRAAGELLAGLTAYEDAIKPSIGLRVQERISPDVAREIARCQSVHRDVSLSF
jgi:hypothetical protein